VLVETERGALRLAALNRAANRAGLKLGMPLAEARSWLPALRVAAFDPAEDRALLMTIASASERFTPLVALRGDQGLMLDITGCAHLFGGERKLGRAICHLLSRMGFSARAALAGTPDAAWAFARFGQGGLFAPGEEGVMARHLPLSALEADESTRVALMRAGFRTLGDLADRPSHLLSARFGREIVDRLEAICGVHDLRITPLRAPPVLLAEKHFSEPVTRQEPMLAALKRLAGDLGRMLEKRCEGGRVFEARFFRSDGVVRHIDIETAKPTREAETLARLLALRMEALIDPIDPGFGFDSLRLSVNRSETMVEIQPDLGVLGDDPGRQPKAEELISRLIARFGSDHVLRCFARDAHDPVQAAHMLPYLTQTPSAAWPEPEPGEPPSRPLTLFSRPQWIEVMAEVPDSPPLRFRWRRMLHEVTRAEGPERIAPEWWKSLDPVGDQPPPTRDYYRIEDERGQRFWVFREGLYEDTNARPRWFLHGLFA
jgi:protein ImuB